MKNIYEHVILLSEILPRGKNGWAGCSAGRHLPLLAAYFLLSKIPTGSVDLKTLLLLLHHKQCCHKRSRCWCRSSGAGEASRPLTTMPRQPACHNSQRWSRKQPGVHCSQATRSKCKAASHHISTRTFQQTSHD